MGLMKLIIMGIDQFGEKNNSTVSYTAVVNDLPAEMAAGRRPFPPTNEMRPLYISEVAIKLKIVHVFQI